MQKLFFTIGLMFVVVGVTSCGGTQQPPPHQLSVDSHLKIDQGRAQKMAQFYQLIKPDMETSSVRQTSNRFKPSDILPFRFTAKEAAAVNAAFPQSFELRCNRGKCVGLGEGRKVQVPMTLEPDADYISFATRVKVYLRSFFQNGLEILEICKVEGLSLKKGFFWGDLNGGVVRYKDGWPRSSTMDVGPWGSYPNNNCQ